MRLPSRLAKRMIRDCRMPTPQEANQQLREPAPSRHEMMMAPPACADDAISTARVDQLNG